MKRHFKMGYLRGCRFEVGDSKFYVKFSYYLLLNLFLCISYQTDDFFRKKKKKVGDIGHYFFNIVISTLST